MAVLKRLVGGLKYHAAAHAATWIPRPIKITGKGTVLVVCAGTSDIPVGEEAAITAMIMGNRVEKLFDVGVAGIHRILDNHARLDAASVLIVVAGMEGALPSVVAGLVDKPVIAVPTSIGYGASFNGLAALLGMLNSCAAGVTVVNIDNGFGAGFAASLINRV
jgi:NCAIR mutase (PurE)-related protein